MKRILSIAAFCVAASLAGSASAQTAAPKPARSPQCGMYGMTCAPAAPNVQYTSGVKSPQCGMYGMGCAPADKNAKYTSGVKSPECGKYGMTCAPMPTAAAAAPGQMKSGRSVGAERRAMRSQRGM